MTPVARPSAFSRPREPPNDALTSCCCARRGRPAGRFQRVVVPRFWPRAALYCCEITMSPSLSELLKLPAGERAELAMALWESLTQAEREAQFELTPEEAAELDRRWTDHVQRPESAIPWEEVRRKLTDRE